jgi:large repetitive protein
MDIRGIRFALLASLALAGCELSLGVGVGPDDDPPSVNLAAAPQSAAPGETIGLVAAADDDYRVVEVQFFRVDVGGDTLLGRDTSAPYALETTLPAGAAGEVRYFARAVDDADQRGESEKVSVTVQ